MTDESVVVGEEEMGEVLELQLLKSQIINKHTNNLMRVDLLKRWGEIKSLFIIYLVSFLLNILEEPKRESSEKENGIIEACSLSFHQSLNLFM